MWTAMAIMQLRTRYQMSHWHFAKKLRVPVAVLQMYEAGLPPSPSDAMKLDQVKKEWPSYIAGKVRAAEQLNRDNAHKSNVTSVYIPDQGFVLSDGSNVYLTNKLAE